MAESGGRGEVVRLLMEHRRVPKADFKETPDFHPPFGEVLVTLTDGRIACFGRTSP